MHVRTSQSCSVTGRCLIWALPNLGVASPQVVDRLEATLRVKRFNQLGGLQLDRDVRHMVVTLSEASPAPCQGLCVMWHVC